MSSRLIKPSLFLTFVFCISLIGASFVYGAIPKDRDAALGAQLVEKKIDTLVSFLDKDLITDSLLKYIEKWLSAMQSPDVPIYQDIKETGSLFNSGSPDADQKLDNTIRKVFGLIIENEDLDSETLAAIQEILALLAVGPEAYSSAGIITGVAGYNKETTKEAYELGPEIPPEPSEGDFEYYGKPYDLHTDFYADDRGFLIPSKTPVDTSMYDIDSLLPPGLGGSGDSAPPVLAVGYGEYYDSSYEGAEDIENININNVSFDLENILIREHTWDITLYSGSGLTPLTAKIKLYNNINIHDEADAGTFSDDWIVFDWYQDAGTINDWMEWAENEWDGAFLQGIAVFLSPGTGEPGSDHPGEWTDISNRNWTDGQGDLSDNAHYSTPISYGTDFYTAMTNFWVYNGDILRSGDIMLDSAFVFRPYLFDDGVFQKTESRYTISLIPRNLVVDQASLDMAIDGVIDDTQLLTRIDNGNPDFPHSYPGEYIPGNFDSRGGEWKTTYYPDGSEDTTFTYWDGYEYGIQTVGQNSNGEPEVFVSDLNWILDEYYTVDMLNRDGFLAYTVQKEEDRMNAEIIDRAHNSDEMRARVAIYRQQGYSDIRARDAAFEEMADAQAGRVFKDHSGNWVRAQQYVLRDQDNLGFQVLSLTLRGGSGPEAGFSAMDWATRISENSPISLPNDLRTLPLNEWLTTTTPLIPSSPYETCVNTTPTAPWLDSMYVSFSNPTGDTFRQDRSFQDGHTYFQIGITNETVTVNGTQYASFDLTSSPGQLVYSLNGTDTINLTLYELPDNGDRSYNLNGELDPSDEEFQDIWDVLRVNESDIFGNVAHDIGESSLEIVLSNNQNAQSPLLGQSIDVVYIPMSRMLWKDREVLTQGIPD